MSAYVETKKDESVSIVVVTTRERQDVWQQMRLSPFSFFIIPIYIQVQWWDKPLWLSEMA